MKIELKTVFGDLIIAGDFSCIADAVKAAIASKKSLSYADLSSANLRSADLSYADLSYANLRSADLRSADLSYADLSSANLSSANLRSANLSSANLSSANLRSADLSYADLSSANLSSANLSSANLSSADLSYANLSEVLAALPKIENPDAVILEILKKGDGTLNMGSWHTCETTHCRAGWYVHLSGPAGRMMEAVWGSSVAGALIFTKAYPGRTVPDFVASDGAALADMEANAKQP